jgi:tRNA(Ile)-lysidine synthase
MNLQILLYQFLEENHHPSKPLLLAYSGGSDSACLLHLLLEYHKRHPLDLHLAHVDHGWRAESAAEAESLKRKAQALKLPFHHTRLDPTQLPGNLEAACRDARFDFFTSLKRTYGYQAVLTAHHADDLAETVLKKVFEGATLPHLQGMQKMTTVGELTLWRPLLEVSKEHILSYLERYQLSWIDDATNRDDRFLRAKFRNQVMPELTKVFGKQINRPLIRLGEEAAELHAYLLNKIKPALKNVVAEPTGLFLDLKPYPLEPIEIRFLLRQLAIAHGFVWQQAVCQTAAQLLHQRAVNKQLEIDGRLIQIDRGTLSISKQKLTG